MVLRLFGIGVLHDGGWGAAPPLRYAGAPSRISGIGSPRPSGVV